jgi:small membrane protein
MMIKVVLLAALAVILASAVRSRSPRHLALRRMAAALLAVGGALAVLFPEAVTSVAHVVGVGRGTDLVLYLFVVASTFTWLGLNRRLLELENRLARLVRAQALAEASRRPEHESAGSSR